MSQRTIAALLFATSSWPASRALSAPPVDPTPLASFFDAHCLECHDSDVKKGGLDLSSAAGLSFERWVLVHDRLAAGEMPPRDESQPNQAERDAATGELTRQLVTADRERLTREGRSGVRRLSRVELENTLRDLLAVPGLRVRESLPEDGKAHGFDRSPGALDYSFVHLDKHLAAVDAALNAATPAFAEKPPVFTYRWFPWNVTVIGTLSEHKEALGLIGLTRDLTYSAAKSRITDDEPKSTVIGLFRLGDESARYRLSPYSPMLDGWHRLTVRGYSFGWDGEAVTRTDRHGALTFGILSKGLTFGPIDLPPNEARDVTLTAWLERGGGMTPGVPDDLMFTPETCERLPHYAGTKTGIRQDMFGPPHPAPGLAVEWIEIEGPIHETWPPESQRSLFGDLPVEAWTDQSGVPQPVQQQWASGKHPGSQPKDIYGALNQKKPVVHVVSADPEADARRLLAAFLRRAFRRPVADADVARYTAIAADRLRAGEHFQDALKSACRAALCSPDFLLLRGGEPGALASRLSYFLWSGPPDDDLLTAVERGGLTRADDLRAQTLRLLDDPKAARFIEHFTGHWLRLREIDATQPDKQLYPEFTGLLQMSMLAETRAYFAELLREDLGVAHLVKSDFAMLNQTLAGHYGIPGVPGHQIRRVTLPAGSVRGPFLTQAAIHKVTADGTTTSPVRRGAFVMEKILGIVPTPPPPGAGSIEPDTRGATTVREQLALHKTSAACATCHVKMDPYGFAMESFDVTGAWRERYRATGAPEEKDRKLVHGRTVVYRPGPAVDSSGVMPDGTPFTDYAALRDRIAADERSLARAFVGHLLSYATGAPPSFSERDEVERILEHARPGGYGMRTLLIETVLSPLFAEF